MKLSQLLDTERLERHIDSGYVSVDTHRDDPLLEIYNYTHKAMFAGVWDDVTTWTRGLVVRNDEVVARPFRKFFNLNTANMPETLEKNLPTDILPEVTDKMDGFLGILYTAPDGQPAIATRGSFKSPQANWATAHYRKHYTEAKWPEGWTPLFEGISHLHRIVVDYPFEDLVLLGMVKNETGQEMELPHLWDWAEQNAMRVVQGKIGYVKPSVLLAKNLPDAEGYVVTWHLPEGPPLKVKLKFEDYCRVHKVLMQTSPVSVWGLLSVGQDIEAVLKPGMPEHFAKWVTGWRNKLVRDFKEHQGKMLAIFEGRPRKEKCPAEPEASNAWRKENALYFLQPEHRTYTPACFMMLDGKNPAPVLWGLVRPKMEGTFRRECE